MQNMGRLDRGRGTVFHAELYVDLFEMLVHRPGGQAENIADIAVGLALGDPQQHFRFPRGQREMLFQKVVVRLLVGGGQAKQMLIRTHGAKEGKLQGGASGLGDRQRCIAAGLRCCPFADPAADMADDDVHAVIPPGRSINEPRRLRGGPVDGPICAHGEQMASGGIKRDPGALRRAGIGKMDADAGAQLVDIDRFRQIIDTAGVQRPHDMFGLRQAGHEDNRHLRHRRIGLEASAGLETVHGGHDGIEQDDIGRDALGDVQCSLPRCGDEGREAGLLQRIGQEAQRFRAVIHQQYNISRGRRLSAHALRSPLSLSSNRLRKCA
ncbi:hypothetical protein AT6N2_C3188 [Agrobacterium tumefaciens]|nr:hypothetical protein AT6N2_C3188 [Agrobacterium tumefaciens]